MDILKSKMKRQRQYISIPNMEIDYSDVRKQTMELCIEGTQESFQQLIEGYIESLIDSLNERFLDLHLFNATKLFSPCYYPKERHNLEKNSERWIFKLFLAFATYHTRLCQQCAFI